MGEGAIYGWTARLSSSPAWWSRSCPPVSDPASSRCASSVALTQAITDPDPAAAKRAFEAMMRMKKIDIAAIEAARRG
jgi:hypothetical protein